MIRKLSLTFLLFVVLAFLIAACGGSNDTIPPTTSLNFPPDIIFYNDVPNGTTEEVRFTGTASDNVWVDSVEISFDNGVSWVEVNIEGQGSRVAWDYEAIAAELDTNSTILTRAKDLEGNSEMSPTGQPYMKFASTSTTDLETLITNAGTGITDDVIYLSSGSGGAYGDTGSNGLSLANSNPIIIVGNGFDQTISVGGIPAIVASSKTFLSTSQSALSLIEATDDLYLRSLRLIGGQVGALASGVVSLDLTVDDCVLVGQKAWGIFVENLGSGVVNVMGSLIDATSADDSSGHGGIYLDSVAYDVSSSLVMRQNQTTPSVPSAGIFIIDAGPGSVRNSVLADNEKSIWTVNSSPIISTCIINGGVTPSVNNTTTGITISFGAGTPRPTPAVNYNMIQDHSSYGVFVEGGTAPNFFHNTVTGNGESAFLFSGNFNQAPLPSMGTLNLPNTTGFNTIFGNSNPNATFNGNNVLVTSGSIAGAPIQSRNNYWGLIDSTNIDLRIDDGPFKVPGAPDIDASSFLIGDPN